MSYVLTLTAHLGSHLADPEWLALLPDYPWIRTVVQTVIIGAIVWFSLRNKIVGMLREDKSILEGKVKEQAEKIEEMAATMQQRETEYAATLHDRELALRECERRTDLDALMREHREANQKAQDFYQQAINALTIMTTSHDGRSDRMLQLIEQQAQVLEQHMERDAKIMAVLEGLSSSLGELTNSIITIRGRLTDGGL